MSCCNGEKGSKVEFNQEGLICYCFNISKQELFDAIGQGNQEAIVEKVKSKMKTLGCHCEVNNPSGKCCLADFTAYIEHFNKNS